VSYKYEDMRPYIFTEQNVPILLKTRDIVFKLCEKAGCCRASKAWIKGDSWMAFAILDYLCELGEIREVTNPEVVQAQDRVFLRVERTA